jgi:hypothetical protein
MQKDCCQVLPSDEEYPFLEQLQKDCFQDEEYLVLELQVQQEQPVRQVAFDHLA